MNKKNGFTLVEIMVVIAILAILFSLSIPNLLRNKMASNESLAQATLKTISNACEMYANTNAGVFPGDETDLTGASPKYLFNSYCGVTLNGYDYTCTFNPSGGGYTITASPDSCGRTGKHDYTVTTGGVLDSTDCI